MPRSEKDRGLQADIPESLHDDIENWLASRKHGAKRQMVQAAIDLFLSLPEPIQGIVLLADRTSPMFSAVIREVVKRLAPMAENLGWLTEPGKMTPQEAAEALVPSRESAGVKPVGTKPAGVSRRT